jgi:hypothetical protein
MPTPLRGLFLLLLLLAVPLAAWAAEVSMLSGATHRGNLLSLNQQEVKFKADGKTLSLKAAEVLSVDLSTASPALPKDAYIRVQLRDGTVLIAKSFVGKGNQAEIKLFADVTLTVPWPALHHVLFQANNPDQATEFDALVAQRPKQDVLRLLSRDGQSVNTFKGILGELDAQGKLLKFEPEGGKETNIAAERIRGLYFARPALTTPAAVCKVIDNASNVYPAVEVQLENNAVRLKTPAGVEAKLPVETVLRFDYSLGKVAFLSDLEPVRKETGSMLLEHRGYRKDQNLEGRPISLGGKTFAKGLSMPSRTVLDYEVTGYNLFRALIGIDDSMTGPAHAVVRIEGDGRELFSTPITRRDVKPKEVELRISGVKRLRLIVDYGEDYDLGDHVDFANARIVK